MNKKDLAFLYGCVIGDGNLYKQKRTKSIILKFTHCLKQKEYLEYKVNNLNRILQRFYKVSIINNNGYPGVKASLCDTKTFKPLYKLFYPKGKKNIVNPEIINNLTPEALALWWMDDGCLSMIKTKGTNKIRARQGFINTYLPLEDNLYLIELLNNKFNLNLKNIKDRKWNRIRLNTTDCKQLIEIVKPYIHPIFNYKIDMQYSIK